MADKKLEKLKKLLEIANQDYATPEEVAALGVAIVKRVEAQQAQLQTLVEKSKAQLSADLDKTVDTFNAQAKRVSSLISDLDKKIQEARRLASAEAKTAAKAVEKKIPARVDLTEIRDEIKSIRASLPDFTALITSEPQAVRDALELLQGDERLDRSAIRGLEEWDELVKRIGGPITGGGWGVVRRFSNLDDVNVQTTRPNNQAIAQYSTTTKKWMTGISITVSDTAPSDPKYGDLWIDTTP